MFLSIKSIGYAALLACFLSGCSTITSPITNSLSRGVGTKLSAAVLNSNDPDTIREALPAYLVTVDALVDKSRKPDLYRSAASLNSAYASQFAAVPEQKQRLADKAWRYARQGACLQDRDWCQVETFSHAALVELAADEGKRKLPLMYNLGSVWAGWIEVHSDDWNAVAQLGQVRVLMERVVVLDERYEQGNAHLYLGVLSTLVPPALGGKPEEGRVHFEKAIEISQGKNLMAKVLYAERYARLVFDRELHDRLLNEVLSSAPEQEGLTLSNVMAQQKARQLLATADNYF